MVGAPASRRVRRSREPLRRAPGHRPEGAVRLHEPPDWTGQASILSAVAGDVDFDTINTINGFPEQIKQGTINIAPSSGAFSGTALPCYSRDVRWSGEPLAEPYFVPVGVGINNEFAQDRHIERQRNHGLGLANLCIRFARPVVGDFLPTLSRLQYPPGA